MSEYEKRLNSKTEKFGNEANREKIKKITDSAGISMSEIASCSYEAREAGVKNGMFMGSALRLCPDLETIPYEFERFVLTIIIFIFYCHYTYLITWLDVNYSIVKDSSADLTVGN